MYGFQESSKFGHLNSLPEFKKEQENLLDTAIDSFKHSSTGWSSSLVSSFESFGSTIKLEPFEVPDRALEEWSLGVPPPASADNIVTDAVSILRKATATVQVETKIKLNKNSHFSIFSLKL